MGVKSGSTGEEDPAGCRFSILDPDHRAANVLWQIGHELTKVDWLAVIHRARGPCDAVMCRRAARKLKRLLTFRPTPMNLRVFRCTPSRVRPPRRLRIHTVCGLYLEPLEDRFVLSGQGTWSAFSPVGPAPRWGAPIVALGPLSVGNSFVTLGTNYFFGGTDGTNTFDDTWAISQGTVLATQMHPATSPLARHDQAAVAFNDKMYIFGGEDAGRQQFAATSGLSTR